MKSEQVTKNMRNRIVSGEFAPGSPIPPRRKLLEQYDVSVATFQKTVNRLIAEGFLQSCRGDGVYIRNNPPHLFQFGLVYPAPHWEEPDFHAIWDQLADAAKEYRLDGQPVNLKRYDVGSRQNTGAAEQLRQDAENGRLSGIIRFDSAPLPKLPEGFPCISFECDLSHTPESHIRMTPDYVALFSECLAVLKHKGCERIAVICRNNLNNATVLRIRQMMTAESGLFLPQEWLLPCDYPRSDRLSYSFLIRGLFSENLKRTPNGLIVLDRNLLPVVISQLTQSGKICGRDIRIACHCNWPSKQSPGEEITYAGFKTRDILDRCLEAIRDYRRNPEAAARHPVLLKPEVLKP